MSLSKVKHGGSGPVVVGGRVSSRKMRGTK